MVSGATMRLTIGKLSTDRPTLKSWWDVLLGVVADFSVEIRGRRLMHETMFPVVELAAALKRWITDLDSGSDHEFSYESMEAEGPLLQFVQHNSGWKVQSPLQTFSFEHVLTVEEIETAAKRFIEEVRRATRSELKLDVDQWLS
jgi:hypothetical protein